MGWSTAYAQSDRNMTMDRPGLCPVGGNRCNRWTEHEKRPPTYGENRMFVYDVIFKICSTWFVRPPATNLKVLLCPSIGVREKCILLETLVHNMSTVVEFMSFSNWFFIASTMATRAATCKLMGSETYDW